MFHILFASFDRPRAADGAVAALRAQGSPEGDVRVVTHAGRLETTTEELPLFETRAATALMKGSFVGVVCGALGGALLAGPLAVAPGGALATIAFTAAAGALFGVFTGVIAGSTDADPTLSAMAGAMKREGTLVSVETATLSEEDDAKEILLRHGGRVTERRLLRARAAPIGR